MLLNQTTANRKPQSLDKPSLSEIKNYFFKQIQNN